MTAEKKVSWIVKGKKISDLIEELQSFENQELEVRISIDCGGTHHPISMLRKQSGYCVLTSFLDQYEKLD